jgi:hypothetical protein
LKSLFWGGQRCRTDNTLGNSTKMSWCGLSLLGRRSGLKTAPAAIGR